MGTDDLPPGHFVVSRRQFYRAMAASPEIQALARWGDRLYRERYENHDPGDEDRSER